MTTFDCESDNDAEMSKGYCSDNKLGFEAWKEDWFWLVNVTLVSNIVWSTQHRNQQQSPNTRRVLKKKTSAVCKIFQVVRNNVWTDDTVPKESIIIDKRSIIQWPYCYIVYAFNHDVLSPKFHSQNRLYQTFCVIHTHIWLVITPFN